MVIDLRALAEDLVLSHCQLASSLINFGLEESVLEFATSREREFAGNLKRVCVFNGERNH